MMTLTVLPFAAVTTLSISSLTSLKRLSFNAKEAGAHFVKTSTGFAGGGATAEDVKLMKDTVG
jgi:deoxyribose-phosphate aldolase